MHVVKRNGSLEKVQIYKITNRITSCCTGLNLAFVDPTKIAAKVVEGLYSGVSTRELDNLAAETAASLVTMHTDFAVLAARIAISNLHKETDSSFSKVMHKLYNNVDPISGTKRPIISDLHYEFVMQNANLLDNAINYDRDYDYSYFGLKTLERSYLLQCNDRIVERPQHMLMRVAIGIHVTPRQQQKQQKQQKQMERQKISDDILNILETYLYMSQRYFTHSSPTLFAAATTRPQLASCFLLSMKDGSLSGMFNTMTQCALISNASGGIGLNIHNVPVKNSSNGCSSNYNDELCNGIVPMLRVVDNVAQLVDQGNNKRPGAFAIYLEPWHGEIFAFLDLKKNTGIESKRARNLFYALWIPDLFMQRVERDEKWTLMCPYKCPGLSNVWGKEFDELYTNYEQDSNRISKVVNARDLWRAIVETQVETGNPYLLYKDACNSKSNQQNLGTIRGSNLCTEIIQYSSDDEIAVCNLASIALNAFVDVQEQTFNFSHLKFITKMVTRNLNKVIDVSYYPVKEARTSNMRHRPLGIGVQGFADALLLLRYPYDSAEAKELNIKIFETIYYGALEASAELAAIHGPYESYKGSPVSKGILQYDMWNVQPTKLWDWVKLKKMIAFYGIRNSLLIAPMPTASTAQIMGNNESFEPYTSNIYTRRVLSGEFQVVNSHLLKDLLALGIWNKELCDEIIAKRGSVVGINKIPKNLQQLYKTNWEISMQNVIDMAADRSPFIDQSQSLNLFLEEPDYGKICAMHFYAWKKGLKTGMYYLRTKAAAQAVQFTIDKTKFADANVCTLKKRAGGSNNDNAKRDVSGNDSIGYDDDTCLSCGS